MAIDLRQVVAAMLTLSMFLMLGNMIKEDHIDPLLEPSKSSNIKKKYDNLIENKLKKMASNQVISGPWKDSKESPRHCWKRRALKGKEETNGYIFFSLTHGPEYHPSQVINAVAVAKQLGATLLIPDIIETKTGHRWEFGEIYDAENFIASLGSIVQVEKSPPAKLSNVTIPVYEIPDKASQQLIASNVKLLFQSKRSLKIVTYFNSSASAKGIDKQATEAYQCLAIYDSLKLKPDLQELVDSVLTTMRGLSKKSNGRFVSVDLSVEKLETKGCRGIGPSIEKCHDPKEIARFLHDIGFHKETSVYLTQKRWHSGLDSFRDAFPNSFTKDAIIPADQKAKIANSETREYDKIIDFYMCVQGDVFVPAFKNKFYEEVVGKRIELGKTQILVPTKNASSAADAEEYTSPYVLNKDHFAYSCFC